MSADRYPRLDGDEGDMVLYRMEWRIRLLYFMAAEELEAADERDGVIEAGFSSTNALAHAVQLLHDDWQNFRHDLVREVRRSAAAGHIQSASGLTE